MRLYLRVMSPNDADGMANSVDPDQTAPLGAVWSGSALFAQAYLSKNLGSLRYVVFQRHEVMFRCKWVSTKFYYFSRMKQTKSDNEKLSGTDHIIMFPAGLWTNFIQKNSV